MIFLVSRYLQVPEGLHRAGSVADEGDFVGTEEDQEEGADEDNTLSTGSPSQVDSEEMYLPLNPMDFSREEVTELVPALGVYRSPSDSSIMPGATSPDQVDSGYVVVPRPDLRHGMVRSSDPKTALLARGLVPPMTASQKRKAIIEEALREDVSNTADPSAGESALDGNTQPIDQASKRRRPITAATSSAEADATANVPSSSEIQTAPPVESVPSKRGARTKTRTTKAKEADNVNPGKGKSRAL